MFDPEQISVSGNMELKNVVYNRPLSLDSEFIKLISDLGKTSADSEIKESTPIDLDIKVTGKNNIRIKTNLIESDLFIDTTISGTTEEPKMSGTVSMKNARIEYKQNDFTVQRGILTFEESRGISPFLDVESFRNITTKIQDDEKDYKIIMYATGYVLDDDLKLTFDSVPQLDQQQLISLLLWGNTGENLTGDLAIAAVTDIMGITTAVRKNFRLSRFELIPKYSELDDKTVLKLVAEKEIYDNLFLLFESNPADTTDQIIQLKYKNKRLEAILEWHNKDRLENSFGGIGFDLKLEYVFE
jgi:translocation and assembly module TamB